MYFRKELSDGNIVNIMAGMATFQRLRTTCFRGRDVRLAGNFFMWSDLNFLIGNRVIIEQLTEDFEDSVKNFRESRKRTSVSVCIEMDYPVGWASTDSRDKYPDSMLEPFQPNQRSKALRVRAEFGNKYKAPKTNLVTIVYSMESGKDSKGYRATIWSAYPGDDIGELSGNITEREKVVFFGFEHPGA